MIDEALIEKAIGRFFKVEHNGREVYVEKAEPTAGERKDAKEGQVYVRTRSRGRGPFGVSIESAGWLDESRLVPFKDTKKDRKLAAELIGPPAMTHHYSVQGREVHVQNVLGPVTGQHHVHTLAGFEAWKKDVRSDAMVPHDAEGPCECGLEPGQARDRDGRVSKIQGPTRGRARSR